MPTTVVEKILTNAELARDIATTNQFSTTTGNTGSGTNRYTWVGAFDGTNNNRDTVGLSGNPLSTNVGQIEKQIADANVDNPNVKSRYYAGVGTAGTQPASGVEPDFQIMVTAEKAYKEYNVAAADWLANNPGGDVTVMLTSFSRGGGTAAVFSQLLFERGITDASGNVLVPPGTNLIVGGVILDTVNTTSNLNAAIVGVRSDADMKYVAAENEYRGQFKALDNSNQTAGTFYSGDGNHSGIGGGQDRGLGALWLGGADGKSGMMGYFGNYVPVGTLDPSRKFDGSATVYAEVGFPWTSYGSVAQGSVRQTQGGVNAPTTAFMPNGDEIQSYSRLDPSTNQKVIVVNTTSAPDAGGTVTRSLETRIPTVDSNGQLTGGYTFGSRTVIQTSADKLTTTVSTLDIKTNQTATTITVKSDIQDDSSFTLTTTYPNNRVVEKIVGDDGRLFQTSTTTPTLGGSQTIVANANGVLKYTSTSQIFDDGTLLVTVKYPGGTQIVTSTDLENNSTRTEYPVPSNPAIQIITDRDSTGTVTATRTITPSLDEENSPIANTYDTLTLDGAGRQLSSGTLQVNPIDGSLTESVYTPPAAGEFFGGVAVTTTTPAGAVRPNNNSAAMADFERGGGAFLALNSLFNARNAQPLGQAGAVVGGLNTGFQLAGTKVPALTGLGAGIGFVSGLTSLASAWDRSDLGGGLVALDSTITSGAQLYLSATGSELTVEAAAAANGFGAASGAVGAAAEACPYLLIAYDLETGNYGGAIGGAIGLYFTGGSPIGAAVGEAIGTLIQSFFSEPDTPPPPSGTAYVIFTDVGGIRITAAGISGGDNIASNRLSGLLLSGGGLIDLIGKHNTTITADLSAILVGIVPQRLGAISYDNTPAYRVSSTDPLTGQDPGLVFNGNTGRLLNPQPGSSAYFQTLDQYYTSNALARQAIAPQWEVATAKAQQDHGLSNSGLSEGERAANLGHLAPRIAAGQTTEHFNPIGIDLNGDGLATISESGSGVYFDIDGTADLGAKLQGINAPHYLKHTAWLNNQDGLLILDKNINGTIDDGEEMFSNSAVNEQSRGIASLAVIDADGNGSIDASDPVFGSLRVWQDKNSNGLLEAGEVKSLSALGISSLNYETGTVTRSGQLAQMSTLTLEADTLGTSYTKKADGILLETTQGQVSLQVTQLHVLSEAESIPLPPGPTPGPVPILHVYNESFTTEENVSDIILVRGYPGVQGLLDADYVSDGSGFTLSNLFNAQHGTLSLDSNAGAITFTPEYLYYGNDAGFDYTVTSPTAGSATAHVGINVTHVDQAPVAVGQVIDRSGIFGYTAGTYGVDHDRQLGKALTAPGYGFEINGYGYTSPQVLSAYGYRDQPVAFTDEPTAYRTGTVQVSDVDDALLSWTIPYSGTSTAVSVNAYGHWTASLTLGQAGATDSFIVRATDPSGKYVDTFVTLPLPPVPLPGDPEPATGTSPVVFDLNNTGFHFVPVQGSDVYFDSKTDGWAHRTAWVDGSAGSGNGILAFDKYHDSLVHDSSQIAFQDYLSTAQTDLEGLAAFDSNHDGQITAADSRYSELGVWVDANNNGTGEAGEYRSLEALGIAAISLHSDQQFRVDNGVTVHGQASFTRTDGSVGQVADVTLPVSLDGRLDQPMAAPASPRWPWRIPTLPLWWAKAITSCWACSATT
jgi:hypothetical protein